MGVFSWVAMGGQVVTLILGSLSVVMDSWWQSDYYKPSSSPPMPPLDEDGGETAIRTGLWYPCKRKCGSVICIRICMCIQLMPAVLSACAIIAFCTQLMPKHNRFLLKTATNALFLQVLLVGLSLFLSWKTHSNFGAGFTVAWASECIAITTLTMMCLLYKDNLNSSTDSLASIEGASNCQAAHAQYSQHLNNVVHQPIEGGRNDLCPQQSSTYAISNHLNYQQNRNFNVPFQNYQMTRNETLT
ncbi:uncharacterized protein LOC142353585 [Convolutriloba macropyga]|uniref:uncharacterized protein LOC142353585 n=1 Tax=Convolutriloba macropyga TaxID=536237 RepID=UPI003F5286E9